MPQDAQFQSDPQSALSTARYIHSVLGELAALAQRAELESTEVLILAARIEALNVVRALRPGKAAPGTPSSAPAPALAPAPAMGLPLRASLPPRRDAPPGR